MEINPIITYNMEVSFGGRDKPNDPAPILINMNVRRNPTNRFKYWMLCQFFPFHIERWDK